MSKQSRQNEAINFSYLPHIVGHLSGLLHLRATQIALEVMAPLELVPKQFIALEFIANNPNLSQKEIANYIGTTAPMMVHVLDSLSQRGLVQRVRSEKDRRKQNIQLTAAGSALLAEIRTRALEADRLLLAEANLSESDKETLLQLLRRLTNREFNESQTSP